MESMQLEKKGCMKGDSVITSGPWKSGTSHGFRNHYRSISPTFSFSIPLFTPFVQVLPAKILNNY